MVCVPHATGRSSVICSIGGTWPINTVRGSALHVRAVNDCLKAGAFGENHSVARTQWCVTIGRRLRSEVSILVDTGERCLRYDRWQVDAVGYLYIRR